MPQILIVALVVAALFWGAKVFANASPAVMARLMQQGGGWLALAAAGLLFLRGRIEVALGLLGLGFYLLGFSGTTHWSGILNSLGKAKKPAATSRVQSAMIEMELDHDSGAMAGIVRAGDYKGRRLADLTRPDCERLHAACRRDDPDGARLLEAYLDGRFPGWREAGDGDADAGTLGGGGAGKMRPEEAYEILGLAKSATREEIAAAHRSLMKKIHPDHGGTANLAARVNEARDVLMNRHG